jgi:hypothetical protein
MIAFAVACHPGLSHWRFTAVDLERTSLSSVFYDFPYPLSEQIQLERFSHDMHSVTETLLADDRVFRIAGDKEHFEVRSSDTGGVSDLSPI